MATMAHTRRTHECRSTRMHANTAQVCGGSTQGGVKRLAGGEIVPPFRRESPKSVEQTYRACPAGLCDTPINRARSATGAPLTTDCSRRSRRAATMPVPTVQLLRHNAAAYKQTLSHRRKQAAVAQPGLALQALALPSGGCKSFPH